MKFSTRIDTDSAASDLFDTVGNFDRIERMLTRRGAVITRIDPAQEPGTGVGWMIGFDWRGQPRQLRQRREGDAGVAQIRQAVHQLGRVAHLAVRLLGVEPQLALEQLVRGVASNRPAS